MRQKLLNEKATLKQVLTGLNDGHISSSGNVVDVIRARLHEIDRALVWCRDAKDDIVRDVKIFKF